MRKQKPEQEAPVTRTPKDTLWNGLRITFGAMIILWVYALTSESYFITFIPTALFLMSIFSTFVLSILHLNKYPEKALAIVALILSTMEISTFITMN